MPITVSQCHMHLIRVNLIPSTFPVQAYLKAFRRCDRQATQAGAVALEPLVGVARGAVAPGAMALRERLALLRGA